MDWLTYYKEEDFETKSGLAGWLQRGRWDRIMFLQRIHIWLAFCKEEGLLSVMFWQRIWIVQSGWPVDRFVQDFFPKHLYHPDGLAPSKGGGFVQIVFARNLYHGEWLFKESFARRLFCQPSSNDLDYSNTMTCSKEERPVCR